VRRVLAASLLLLSAAGCRKPKPTSAIFHYTAIVDGAVYESTEGREPAEITLAAGELPAAAEAALMGLKPGQETEIEVANAYGPRDEKLIRSVPLTQFGGMAKDLVVGAKILGALNGRSASARVLNITGGLAVLDFNHPLAGKTVRFRLRLVSAR
jgi:FKBP-type peptidyl-prolyl cis-trans isomerase 2